MLKNMWCKMYVLKMQIKFSNFWLPVLRCLFKIFLMFNISCDNFMIRFSK